MPISLAGEFSAEDTVTEVSISVFSVVLPETVLSTQPAIWQMQATGPGEHKPDSGDQCKSLRSLEKLCPTAPLTINTYEV